MRIGAAQSINNNEKKGMEEIIKLREKANLGNVVFDV